jgi:hypothetical protein
MDREAVETRERVARIANRAGENVAWALVPAVFALLRTRLPAYRKRVHMIVNAARTSACATVASEALIQTEVVGDGFDNLRRVGRGRLNSQTVFEKLTFRFYVTPPWQECGDAAEPTGKLILGEKAGIHKARQ